MNPADLQDPRIQQLIAALKGRAGGHGPLFGGGPHLGGGGQGIRARADYFRPGQAGINYNPLQAQMAQGAPGILGLNSGTDSNAPQSIPGASAGDPAGGVTGVAPQIGDAVTGPGVGGPTSYGSPQIGDAATGTPYGGYTQNPDGTYSAQSDTSNNQPAWGQYRRAQGLFNGAY